MSKSRFVLDKFAKLIEQGLLSYKDLSDEVSLLICGSIGIKNLRDNVHIA